jgi:hypothetical protein
VLKTRARLVAGAAAVAAVVAAVAGMALAAKGPPETKVASASAATALANVVNGPASSEAPSARALREGSVISNLKWHRFPALEQSLGVREVDFAVGRGGSVCFALIDAGQFQAGAYGCWAKLNKSGDLQTTTITTAGQPVRVLGIVPNAVRSVMLHTTAGDMAAQVANNIVAWVAPASAPATNPTGATVTLDNGAALTTGPDLAVSS